MNKNYEIVDNVIYTSSCKSIANPKGVGHYYYTQMIKYKDRIAQIDGRTKQQETFEALLQRSIRTALTMKEKGLKPGDNILVCTDNHFDNVVPHIASFFIGTVMSAIHPNFCVKEASHHLKQILPKLIFAAPAAVAMIEMVVEHIKSNSTIVVFGETKKHTPFSEFLRPRESENVFQPRTVHSLDEIALVVFSSGTTGTPKGICFSHSNMLRFSKECKTEVGKVSYASVNPYWGVFAIWVHECIEFGYTRIFYPFFDVNEPWTLFYQHVDIAFLPSLLILQMIRSKKPENLNLRNVKILRLGGSICTKKEINEIMEALPYTRICHIYGQTELFTGILAFDLTPSGLELANKKVGSVGTLIQGISYKIVDIDSETTLGANQIGELRIKSPSRFSKYHNHISSECFDSDGWLKTGDLLYYDEDMCFYIIDRISETFKFKYFHISPTYIEKIIMNLEPVETAIVIGVPHKTDVNLPMAVVKLKPNVKNLSAEEITQYVEKNVENKNRLRGGVRFVSDFPKTANGKISRHKLKQLILHNTV